MNDIVEAEVVRVASVVREALGRIYSDDETAEDMRLISFVIVPVLAYTDADGDNCEGVAVWGESQSQLQKLGVLDAGRECLLDLYRT